jgi:hypothetical protein
VHWSPKEKWYNLKDYREEKGVHFLGLCRMMGNESLLVGTAARNINCEIIMHVLGRSAYVCMFLGWSAYVYKHLGWTICVD